MTAGAAADTGVPERLTDLRGTWTLDAAHSLAAFSVRHMTIARVTGRFDLLAGELEIGDGPAVLRVRISTASASTGHPRRDELVRSPDFLDSEEHPEMTFEAEMDPAVVGESWTLPGTLTIRGVSRPVELAVHTGGVVVHRGATRAGFSATTTIDRRDFGLAFDAVIAGGGAVVSNKVDVVIEAELVGPAT